MVKNDHKLPKCNYIRCVLSLLLPKSALVKFSKWPRITTKVISLSRKIRFDFGGTVKSPYVISIKLKATFSKNYLSEKSETTKTRRFWRFEFDFWFFRDSALDRGHSISTVLISNWCTFNCIKSCAWIFWLYLIYFESKLAHARCLLLTVVLNQLQFRTSIFLYLTILYKLYLFGGLFELNLYITWFRVHRCLTRAAPEVIGSSVKWKDVE